MATRLICWRGGPPDWPSGRIRACAADHEQLAMERVEAGYSVLGGLPAPAETSPR